MATFLLEIQTEEIPAAALPGARRQLEELFAARLGEAGFSDLTIAVFSTSRRLAVLVDNLPERQPDRSEEMTGPPVRVAVAEGGGSTPAGEGFARKVGLPFAEIGRIETEKGEYLVATVVHEGRATAEILADMISGVVSALRFPKMMRWGDGSNQFVRPVHGVVALLDETIIPVQIFGIESGRSTVGHRVHAPEIFALQHASDYVGALAERSVSVDQAVRRREIEALAEKLAGAAGARVHTDPGLMAEHVELVEWPGLLAGSFDERYLDLPPEVVVTTLRYHQKCLILEDEIGALKPNFIAVADRRDDPEGLVLQGNEWVIGARLADAEFFFNEDRKRQLADLVPDLERLEFHRVLGSLEDKASRVAEIAVVVADAIGSDVDREALRGAARLAKVDLLTNMVVEFPELQGVMGGHYLRLGGEAEELWTAVRDHYLPVGFDGSIPQSETGRLVGVADRLDTVAGLFAVGARPSGSKDPFGLRRAAQGAVKIVADSGWPLDMDVAIGAAVEGAAGFSNEDTDTLIETVTAFVADRVRRWLTDIVGVSGDTAEAVMAVGWSRLPDVVARAEALERVREADSFRSLALAFKRVRNITEGQPDAEVDPALFDQAEEKELFDATKEFQGALAGFLPEHRVDEAFRAMEPLADVLERFFVEVLVMCEDEKLRANRIALLKNLGREFSILADLSKLQVEGGEG
jgi:glycyl-tRNA synthetase beta chain